MNVMEIYRSVQGEGMLMGVPTTFVRFFACNLRCSWCDTKYSWSLKDGGFWEVLTPEEVSDKIFHLNARHVVLTGGEPTLQRELEALVGILKARGFHVTVETNATIFVENIITMVDLWSLSPKLVSAGRNYIRHNIINNFLSVLRSDQQQWKFVVRDDDDEFQLRSFLSHNPVFIEQKVPIILQPEGEFALVDYAKAMENLASRISDPFWDNYYVRVLPQMHVIIWGRKRLV